MDSHIKEAQVAVHKMIHTFSGLHPATKYMCSISANVRSGAGPLTNIVVWTQSSGIHQTVKLSLSVIIRFTFHVLHCSILIKSSFKFNTLPEKYLSMCLIYFR